MSSRTIIRCDMCNDLIPKDVGRTSVHIEIDLTSTTILHICEACEKKYKIFIGNFIGNKNNEGTRVVILELIKSALYNLGKHILQEGK